MNNLSIHDQQFGRFDESLHWARRAFVLSGRRANDYYHMAVPLFSLRDDDLTWRWLTDAPDSPRVQSILASVEILRGRDADANARMKRVAQGVTGSNEEVNVVLSEVAFLTDSDELESLTEPLMPTSAHVPGVFPTETARLRYAYAVKKRGDSARATALATEAERFARQTIEGGNEAPIGAWSWRRVRR